MLIMKIKCIRKKLNMSRAELASALGITYAAIANYEQRLRTPSLTVAYKLIDLCRKNKIKINLEDIYCR